MLRFNAILTFNAMPNVTIDLLTDVTVSLSIEGDIAFRYMKFSTSGKYDDGDGTREVTVCDINEHMLKVGERRSIEQGLTQGTFF